jgi:nitroimidazol reductase NimA-like FMN-containing flavoprotein (pyridoxamine 5'-phosphate oxidase superfamily)
MPDDATESRPSISPSYGIAKDRDGMLPWSHVSSRLARSRNYWICTTRPDGRPHAMPVWGVWVNETLYFGTARDSVKARNMAANPALTVHLESGDDCVILEGTAKEMTDGDGGLFDAIADAYADKYDGYRPELATGEGTFALRPRVAFAWLEKDYPRTATRWRFRDG